MQGFGDFDFLVGEWRIANERLRQRLKGSTDWEVFAATSKVEKVMPDADGVYGGNLDQMFVPEKGFTGMTLRLYDPAAGLWSIYWSDTISHRLFPPTVGRFEGGRGVFFGDDVEGGVPVKVRFDWTAGEAPVWEQAMSADGGRTWEKNWVMRFESKRYFRCTLTPALSTDGLRIGNGIWSDQAAVALAKLKGSRS